MVPRRAPHRPPDEAQNASYIAFHQSRIKAMLSYPASAQFRGMFVSRALGRPAVCGEVNSKNAFGGYVGFVRFVSGGDQQAIEGQNMREAEMDQLWPRVCGRSGK